MRVLVAVLALLLAVPIVPASPTLTLLVDRVQVDDPRGDGQIHGVPAEHVDITHALVALENQTLSAELGLANAGLARDAAETMVGRVWYWIELEYRGERFDLGWDAFGFRFEDEDENQLDAFLMHQDGEAWAEIYRIETDVDRQRSVFPAAIPLEALVTRDGFTPGPGERVEVLAARAYTNNLHKPWDPPIPDTDGIGQGGDDAEFPEGSWVDVAGDVSDGLAIGTVQPVRFSNGEATTYHWPVSVLSRGGPMDAIIRVEADEEVSIHAPATIQLGEAPIEFDVYATTPFAHAHGGGRELLVHVEGNGLSATLPLEIRYLTIPQPAGHHDTLYLHGYDRGRGYNAEHWMNTLDEDKSGFRSFKMEGVGHCVDAGARYGALVTDYVLRPALRIGLDGHIADPATFQGTFETSAHHSDITLAFDLQLYDPLADRQGEIDLAGAHVATLPITAQGAARHTIDVEIPMRPELDRVPPGQDNLRLRIAVCQTGTPVETFGSATPIVNEPILHEASLKLPLNEYRDIIPFEAGSGLNATLDISRRAAAPGTPVLWTIETEGAGEPVEVRVFGVHADTIRPIPAARLGEPIHVIMDVPDVAGPAEAIIELSMPGDALANAAFRLVVDIDPDAGPGDAAAISALEPQTKGSPGLPVLVVLAGVLLARRLT